MLPRMDGDPCKLLSTSEDFRDPDSQELEADAEDSVEVECLQSPLASAVLEYFSAALSVQY